VSRTLRFEVVTLDGASKAFALRHARHINFLTRLEYLDRHARARLVLRSDI